MNPDKQRIAIAEACGYKDIELRLICEGTGMDAWLWCSGVIGNGGVEIPHYLRDLNAMHEAEAVLMETRMVRDYVTYLCTICEHAKPMVPVWHATATQRAEAFLRTIGKWEDDK